MLQTFVALPETLQSNVSIRHLEDREGSVET
jgi:hypothetical protein